MADNKMTSDEILESIKVLTEVVRVNSGFFGNEKLVIASNKKIADLISMLQ